MRRKTRALLAAGGLAFLGACSDERLARLEECGGLSDNHPLCFIYMLTGAEWAMTGAFLLGVIGLVLGVIDTGKKRNTNEVDDDAKPDPDPPD